MLWTAPAGTYRGFFFRTIMELSLISALDAPFLSTFVLEVDDISD